MLIKWRYCVPALILLLTGCQHSANQTEQPVKPGVISPAEQVNQLAAMVAGGEYLRQQCKDKQVPEREALIVQVISLAQQRGWDTHNKAYQTLSSQSEALYQGLLSDETPSSTQCEFFKKNSKPQTERR